MREWFDISTCYKMITTLVIFLPRKKDKLSVFPAQAKRKMILLLYPVDLSRWGFLSGPVEVRLGGAETGGDPELASQWLPDVAVTSLLRVLCLKSWIRCHPPPNFCLKPETEIVPIGQIWQAEPGTREALFESQKFTTSLGLWTPNIWSPT